MLSKQHRTKPKSPLYLQTAKTIRTYIAEHKIEVGDALPPERELSLIMDVSRVTIRKALDKLVEDQIVERRRGAGTFVLPRISHLGTNLSGFTNNTQHLGHNIESIWIMRAYGKPTEEEAEILKISRSDKVVRLGRVRLSDGQPLAIEQAVVPARFLPDINTIEPSLYRALESKGNRPAKGVQRVRASLANPTEAGLLSVAENSEVLRIERRSFLQDGTPIELTRSAYRGDLYDIVMPLENSQLS